MDGTFFSMVGILRSKNKQSMRIVYHMDVSKNSGTPKSSILIGFSIINHPFWGILIFGNTHILPQDTDNSDPIIKIVG